MAESRKTRRNARELSGEPCPFCGAEDSRIGRALDKKPDGIEYFACSCCGGSYHTGDLWDLQIKAAKV